MLDPGRYPERLAGRQEVPGRGGFDLRDALEGVLELVELVAVPPGHDFIAELERVGARPHAGARDRLVPGIGRCGQGIDRPCRDSHAARLEDGEHRGVEEGALLCPS